MNAESVNEKNPYLDSHSFQNIEATSFNQLVKYLSLNSNYVPTQIIKFKKLTMKNLLSLI